MTTMRFLSRAMLAFTGILLASSPAFPQATPVMPINQAGRVRVITASDTVDLPIGPTLGIFNGNSTACNIAIIAQGDTASVTWKNVQPGAVMPIAATRVLSTNTTCTDLLAFYYPQ